MDLDFEKVTHSNFEKTALQVFKLQAEDTLVYKQYIEYLGIKVQDVKSLSQIPFLPISFFKTHQVFNKQKKAEVTFTSSGTTGLISSKHFVSDLNIYRKSFEGIFKQYFGGIQEYCILALLPSYLERGGSSLVYMADTLIKKSKHSSSGFYLNNYEELALILADLDSKGQKTILLGVSYALLDLLDVQKFNLKNTFVIETGGMKGQRKEMIKEEFYSKLKRGFGLQDIHSEYGMTELLSQAYSKTEGLYSTPPWMRVLVRDVNDPFCLLENGKSGGLNIIDLANIDSCSFIATQDLGKINPNNTFSILGRFDNSDIRGCNLLAN